MSAPQRVRSGARLVLTFLSSRAYFLLVLAAFTGGAALIALTARETIYDERYHLDLIKQFADGWLPFIENSAQTASLGDVEHSGSFLFHYLASFPYRILAPLGPFVTTVGLRLICVALVSAGLALWHRECLRAHPSRLAANAVITALAATPLMSMVAATVNYDNLLFFLSAPFFAAIFRINSHGGRRAADWLWFAAIGFLASVTKFTFVPVFAALTIVLLIVHRRALGAAWTDARERIRETPAAIAIPGLLLLAGLGLAFSRYGVNLIAFGSPAPDCAVVEPESYCRQWGPWARNERLDAAYEDMPAALSNLITFFATIWLPYATEFLTFVGVVGEGGTLSHTGTNIVTTYQPTLVIVVTALALIFSPLIPKNFRWPAWLAIGVHLAIWFGRNYSEWLRFGEPVGLSPRYFFPFLPLILLMAVLALRAILQILPHPEIPAVLLALFMLLTLTQGGGPLGYFLWADAAWADPSSPFTPLALGVHKLAVIMTTGV